MTAVAINPEMIKLARESRGLSGTAVANRLGITQSAYWKIESGQHFPNDRHVSRLCEILDYPPSFFTQTDRVWGTASPHHRKRKSVSRTRLGHLEADLNVLRLNIRHLTDAVDLEPPFEVPAIDLGTDVGTAAEAAQQVRRLWRVPTGPVSSMVRVLEDAGVIIVERPFTDERIDAISIWGPGEFPVILMNALYSNDRKRHTLAHETGHLVLHARDITESPEAEADEFARELLMPAAEIQPDLRGLRFADLPDLKRRWRVSMRSLVYHARAIGELDARQSRYLFMRLNEAFGAKSEPIDVPAEVPTLLPAMLHRYLTELGFDIDGLATVVNRFPDDFRRTFGFTRPLHVV
jgi:Zn-dependent peptidase ImmA (M78 family)/DNA-binding XRE family transcriptional regulator